MIECDLIFDLGLFDGSDSEFYLRKGFLVVAVEAQPDLCQQARDRFADAIAAGRLAVVERAIWTATDERIPFYVHSGWSSAYRQSAERDGGTSGIIEVATITLDALFEQFGVPYYLKCDIEGSRRLGRHSRQHGRSAGEKARDTLLNVPQRE
jgi:FkbM family methyltransferase